MPEDTHDQAEELLPWYATGQLDAADRALVENHLASCARCQRQLADEQVLIDQFQAMSPEIDSSWAQLRGQIEARPPARPGIGETLAEFWELLKRPVVAAIATAQVAFVALAAMLFQWLSQPTYVALGSGAAASSANIIVIFRPEARESETGQDDQRHAKPRPSLPDFGRKPYPFDCSPCVCDVHRYLSPGNSSARPGRRPGCFI